MSQGGGSAADGSRNMGAESGLSGLEVTGKADESISKEYWWWKPDWGGLREKWGFNRGLEGSI